MSKNLVEDIAVLNLGLGNIYSVEHALSYLNLRYNVVDKNEDLTNYKGIILPGVGSFGDAMEKLEFMNLKDSLTNALKSGIPYLGLCLGLQILFSESSELGIQKGLGIFDGSVDKLSSSSPSFRVPHVGWNQLQINDRNESIKNPLREISKEDDFYFVHSYVVNPRDQSLILSTTKYHDQVFCSSVLKENIFAVQFHPEKSCDVGLRVIKNWSEGFLRKIG